MFNPTTWTPGARRPAGTFERNSLGAGYVVFHGNDGSTTSYRHTGNVQHPEAIDSTFASPTYTPLVMKSGTDFFCTDWGTTATGSHDLLGPATADTQVSLAETAPNYFQDGTCTMGDFTLSDDMTSTSFTAYRVEKVGSRWDQNSATPTINSPATPTPTPTATATEPPSPSPAARKPFTIQ